MSAAERLKAAPLREVVSVEERIRRDGRDPISWSALQPGLSYFQTPQGFVPYAKALGVSLSLGGPVASDAERLALARTFLNEQRGAALFYVDDALAFGLGREAFRASLGCDRVLNLRDAETFAAPAVSSAIRKAARAQLTVEEVDPNRDRGHTEAWVARVNASALAKSVLPYEMRFLNRPLSLEPSAARFFALKQRGVPFGFAVLDPAFDGGRPSGYLLNLIRFEPTSLWGVYWATVKALGDQLHTEGVEELSLGFCPMSRLDVENSSAPLRPQLKWLQRRSASVAYFSRLEAMKRELAGSWRRRWLLTRGPQLVTPLMAFLSLTGIPLGQLLRDGLADAYAGWRSRKTDVPKPQSP